MPRYRVQSIVSQNQWSSTHGPMLGFDLGCLNLDSGQPEVIQINSKPDNPYAVGNEFSAEWTGKEYNGIKKMKRAQAQNTPQSNGGASSSPATAQTRPSEPPRKAMPWNEAALLIKAIIDHGLSAEMSAVLFDAILDGKVENPVKPKTTVTHYGNVIETAGIGQATWDEMWALCERYAKLADNKALRALLIATCQVQTRNDLTEANGALFIAALKLAIAAEEAKQAPVPEDEEIPF